MPTPHIIRLRAPWTLQAVVRSVPVNLAEFEEQTADLPPAAKTEVPGDWTELLGADFFGRVRYTRPFNTPTNLDSDERVWLVCEGVDGAAEFSLNGTSIFTLAAPDLPAECDVTGLLRPHNLLAVEVSLFPPGHARHVPRVAVRAGRGGGITGEVRLEIRRGAT
jgi:beta-galactosidase/beta-glucuronidase